MDSHVGKHIFDQVLSSNKGILKSSTRILVTNALYMLKEVDRIVLLKNGHVEAVGQYDELLITSTPFAEMIHTYNSSLVEEEEKEEILEELVEVEEAFDFIESIGYHELIKADRTLSVSSIQSKRSTIVDKDIEERQKRESKTLDKSQLIQSEAVESGQISLSVYKKFAQALSPWWTVVIFACYISNNIFGTGTNFWLSFWTSQPIANGTSWTGNENGLKPSTYYLVIYILFGLGQTCLVIAGWLSIVFSMLRASRSLHSKLLETILHAPMYFFDTTPLGRIVNRFSKDIDVIDNAMQFNVR